MKRIKHNQTIGRKEREVSIVKKLLAEKRRWKQIQALQNKTYDYKIDRRKRKTAVKEITEEQSMVSVSFINEVIIVPFYRIILGLRNM